MGGFSPKETRLYNGKTCELISVFLNIAPDFIKLSEVEELSRECNVSRECAFAELLFAACGQENREYFEGYFRPMVRELCVEDFINNSYFKNIDIREAKKGKWHLTKQTLKPCEAFVCNDFLVTDDGRLIPQVGFFSEEYVYPCVLEDGREWMTLMPNETVTTDPAVEKAFGKVLTYGLGLGYFAYMASQKEDVESVTVVEMSRDVIELFEEYILPQFPNKDKIRIIEGDALKFARDGGALGYDFLFADIWHDAYDGRELYLKLKEAEGAAGDVEYTYWIEDTIKCYLEKELWE